MPEEIDVPIDKAQETIEEQRRAAAGEGASAEERRARWLDYLAMSTALFAVIAAAAALEAGNYANEALFQSTRAVLVQTQAVDTWSQFQADSIKKYVQLSMVTLLHHVGGTRQEIAAAQAEAARRQQNQSRLQATAATLTSRTEELNRQAERQLEYHHRFAIAVTLLQVAIGLSAIAALLRMPLVWYVSLAAGALATAVFVYGFVPAH